MAKEREVNTVNYSPLRYPGGKSRLAPFISLLIQKSKIETPIYVEPFAGGAGVALSLLLNSAVDVRLIEDFESDLYEGAVVPIALAQKYTAISLQPGGKILDVLAQTAIKQ